MNLFTSNTKLFKIILGPLAAIMALVMTFTANVFYKPGVMDMPVAPDDFTPIIRFTVASDVHLKDEGGEAEAYRLGLMIRSSYNIAENSSPYTNLDGIAFCGDLTDQGTLTQLQKFKDICDANFEGPTKNLTVLGNHEYKYDSPNTVANFENIVGLPTQFHTVINGIHFIGVSPDRDGSGYTVETQRWLYKQLKEAVAESSDNPIFVFQHHHVWGTVYGSLNWGSLDLTAVLSQFPQVIDFSGHSHYPMNDPVSIWQGAFTALGTATLSYFEMEYFPLTGGQYPSSRNAAQIYVVEVDAKGATKIRCYDLLASQFIGETYYIATPADKTTFAYSPKNRIAKSTHPTFAADAKITPTKTEDGSYSIHFPAATDSIVVRQYEVIVAKQWGGIAWRKTHFSDYFFTPIPTEHNINIGHLESGQTYTATITAANAYYLPSKPISVTFTAE